MSRAYTELDHPADIWLAVNGEDLGELFEHGLYAFFRQIADLDEVEPQREVLLATRGESVETALRALLAEALFLFETEAFLAAGARVTVTPDGPALEVSARLWGESADRGRHSLSAEVKAVTYHQLTAGRTAHGGWRATVLLDV
jgi:SHS2 domain-containing protein